MEDNSPLEQNQTAKMNTSKAPQKVEVVVANPSANSEVNIQPTSSAMSPLGYGRKVRREGVFSMSDNNLGPIPFTHPTGSHGPRFRGRGFRRGYHYPQGPKQQYTRKSE